MNKIELRRTKPIRTNIIKEKNDRLNTTFIIDYREAWEPQLQPQLWPHLMHLSIIWYPQCKQFKTMILNNRMHTCQPGHMPPNMDGGLLLSHPCIVPSPSRSSNKMPSFDKVVDRTEGSHFVNITNWLKITTPIIGISKQCISHNIGPLTLRLIQPQQYFQPQF